MKSTATGGALAPTGTQIGKWQHRLNKNELIIVLCISVITYPQHINYTETAGLSVVGRFMMLVLFYVQLRQPGGLCKCPLPRILW